MALIVAFAVAAALTPAVAALAHRIGVVDRPGPLKVHRRPVAYLGGVAVLAGAAAVLAPARPLLLVPLVLACLLGLADDVGDLSPRLRLGAEFGIGAATAAVVPVRGPLGAAVTVVAVVALLNAVNLLDGLDALASGVATVSALGFAVVLDGDGRVAALALAGALAGFLVWNRPPARIYLGDAGSYLVGTALALLLAAALAPGRPVASGAAALLAVAVPVADTAVAVVRRFRAGRPLLLGDRGHVYDQLVDGGATPVRATLTCIAAQTALVAAAVAVAGLPAALAVAAVTVVVAGSAGVVLWRFTSPASWTT